MQVRVSMNRLRTEISWSGSLHISGLQQNAGGNADEGITDPDEFQKFVYYGCKKCFSDSTCSVRIFFLTSWERSILAFYFLSWSPGFPGSPLSTTKVVRQFTEHFIRLGRNFSRRRGKPNANSRCWAYEYLRKRLLNFTMRLRSFHTIRGCCKLAWFREAWPWSTESEQRLCANFQRRCTNAPDQRQQIMQNYLFFSDLGGKALTPLPRLRC